ncbi:hypothetical protein A2755_00225 [Candidatus Wolfebacteria bacterium RIFCSPHIGHO2_01_FULL_48_22]|uniref:FAD-binding FR-type domain-containing protein n=1 Tax=Candidatus Wolfebacteria bacterium RIFCSPHIGHO2_01_FULL_48_22 TaxID=1802555 RepID=A0A1F8DWX1_9BACT|nr:MAG: hypothetical protein A2755_00225 [Candidatus Wolfebacteria bacterium RIFCSPHIGHO2_01_FULL_48_22]
MKKLLEFIDATTMYRLMLYALLALGAVAIIFGFAGLIPHTGYALMLSAAVLIAVCYGVNYALAKIFKAPATAESSVITALIVFFIMTPAASLEGGLMLALAGAIAMASKYAVAYRGKHLFNPAVFAAVVIGFIQGGGGAAWWVSAPALLPFVLMGGVLVVKKVDRFAMFFACAIAGIAVSLALGNTLGRLFAAWPVLFLAAYMLTEPQTTPPTKRLRIVYGVLVGFLASWPIGIGVIYMSPELALVIGNLFSYAAGLKRRITLILQNKLQLTHNTYEFIFKPDRPFAFRAGQYLEWSLPHTNQDLRGIRRFFTIASSPTEHDVRLGVRFTDNGSTFKKHLFKLQSEQFMTVAQLAGDFTLPQDANKKLVFIAGGIGITPYRSMLQYLMDTNDRRDIVLFYSCSSKEDFAYREFLKKAEEKLGIRVVFLATSTQGFLTEDIIQKHVPNANDRTYYLSGPKSMVDAYKRLLKKIGIPRRRIRTDYFPGYA